jgi:NAD(P)H-hydrate epimerase
LFPRRRRASHKGNYGHVLIVGGAQGYSGAVAMAARAATRSGVGLVTVMVPEGIAQVVAAACPEAMVHGADETETGSLSSDGWRPWRERLTEFNALLAGPGMTRNEETRRLVRQVLHDGEMDLVMDADAISVFEGKPQWFMNVGSSLVLTPHPGELGALTVQDVEEIQADRCGAARRAAAATRATVVLKGAGTVVAQEEGPAHINLTGNPGMATGGTGDVLAGLLVGLLAQGLQPLDAARAAVYLHGKAGDLAAWRRSQAGVVAGDVIDEIPYAFRDVTLR